MDQNEILDIFRNSEALLEGHFELRSGLHSARFFQCANVLQHPRSAATLCKQLVAMMRPSLGDELGADAVISPAMGGIIVGHEVAEALGLPHIFAEKEDGKLVMRRFSIQPGQRFLIAEDVITRGGRVDETIAIVREAGAEVVAVGLLVDRSGGKAQFGIPTFSLLKMEPVVHDPQDCPMCKDGLPLVHPGS